MSKIQAIGFTMEFRCVDRKITEENVDTMAKILQGCKRFDVFFRGL